MKKNKEGKRKGKKRMTGWFIFIGILLILGIPAAKGWTNLSKEHKEARSVSLNGVNFKKLKDGIYTGSYEGGMYRWRANKVEVTVADGKVSHIKLLESKAKLPTEFTGKLYGSVIEAQTLQVDTVSGATLDTKAFLKSVEVALKKAQ